MQGANTPKGIAQDEYDFAKQTQALQIPNIMVKQ